MEPRSTSRSTEPDGLIVGTVRGPHGVRGEVRVTRETDAPDRFHEGGVLSCDGIGPLTIASVRGTSEDPIIRFAGYTSRPAADALKNRLLRVPLEEARRAAGDAYLWLDLIGLEVRDPSGIVLGTVAEVLRAGGADVLVVRGERELLLPMIESVVREVDLQARTITAVPLEGL